MKHFWIFRYLLLCAVFLALVGITSAQDDFTLDPSTITIAATTNDSIDRTITLRANADLTDVQFISSDLVSEDSRGVIPAARIKIEGGKDTLTANQLVTLHTKVDLTNLGAGRYAGSLFINHANGLITVPIVVTVKDLGFGAGFVLVIGIIVGMITTWYRDQLLPRDQILSQFARLQQAINTYKTFPEPFKQKIAAYQVDMQQALEASEWENARQNLKNAQTLRYRWERDRAAWEKLIQQWQMQKEYLQRLEKNDLTLPDTLKEQLEAVIDPEQPVTAAVEKLRAVRSKIVEIEPVAQKLENLNEFRGQYKANDDDLRESVGRLIEQLRVLDVNDATALQNFQSALEAADKDARDKIAPASRDADKRPSTPPALGDITPSDSQWRFGPVERQIAYRMALYGITIIVLILAGYGQLYQNNPTFGVNGAGDYLTLFAFGFGGEAARATVTDVLRGMNLPGYS